MSHCKPCGNTVEWCGCGEDCEPFTPQDCEDYRITRDVQERTARALCDIRPVPYVVPAAKAERIRLADEATAERVLGEIRSAARDFLAGIDERLLDEDNPPFVTRPWSLSASSLKSEKDLEAAFAFESEVFPLTNLPSVFVDRLLGEHFEAPPALLNGLCLSVNDDAAGQPRTIPVFAKPDGLWTDEESGARYVLEVKTIRDVNRLGFNLDSYLRQVAAYQLLRYNDPDSTPEDDRFLLVVIGLDARQYQLIVLEVLGGNLMACASEWKQWFKRLDMQSFKVDQLISFYTEPVSIKSIKEKQREAKMAAAAAELAAKRAKSVKKEKAAPKSKNTNIYAVLK